MAKKTKTEDEPGPLVRRRVVQLYEPGTPQCSRNPPALTVSYYTEGRKDAGVYVKDDNGTGFALSHEMTMALLDELRMYGSRNQ